MDRHHELRMRLLAAASIIAMSSVASAAEVPVKNSAELTAAVANAKPGDTIVLAAGTYQLGTTYCNSPGTAAAPIVVKSAEPLASTIEFNGVEGFAVTGANWQFEGLDIKGVCANDSDCEHAFHVTGAAENFVLRTSRVVDFNAQLKVNAAQINGVWTIPHRGLVEGNEIFDARARNTDNPTTKLDIDTGDGWIVRANTIRDFQKGAGDQTSYGAFMKSGGNGGLFERNLVICSLNTTDGVRVGLSFGGGGTDARYCAPAFDAATPCDVEHKGGTMRNNIIVNCTDVGIYLNRSQNTKIFNNTLIATSGVDFRFDTTSGVATANVVSSQIRMRDGGTFTGTDNIMNVSDNDFAAMYLDPLKGDLRKKGDLSKLIGKGTSLVVTDDYCGRARIDTPDLGALEHSLGDCDTMKPPLVGTAEPGNEGSAGQGGSAQGGDSGADGGGGGASGEVGGSGGSGASGEDGTPSGGSGANLAGGASVTGGCNAAPAAHVDGALTALTLVALIATRRRTPGRP